MVKPINRRVRRQMREIDRLCQALDRMIEQLTVPTQEELGEMLSGIRPLTLETLLLGVLGRSQFLLTEAWAQMDRYAPYTPAAFSRGHHRQWQEELKQALLNIVRLRTPNQGQTACSTTRPSSSSPAQGPCSPRVNPDE